MSMLLVDALLNYILCARVYIENAANVAAAAFDCAERCSRQTAKAVLNALYRNNINCARLL